MENERSDVLPSVINVGALVYGLSSIPLGAAFLLFKDTNPVLQVLGGLLVLSGAFSLVEVGRNTVVKMKLRRGRK